MEKVWHQLSNQKKIFQNRSPTFQTNIFRKVKIVKTIIVIPHYKKTYDIINVSPLILKIANSKIPEFVSSQEDEMKMNENQFHWAYL